MVRLLVDLDGVLYKGLFAVEGYYRGVKACENILERIMDRWDTREISLFLSGPENFRKKIDPSYKANRVSASKPQYLHDAREYFIKYWGAIFSFGLEADDLIAMNHDEDCIICSVDKDFFQLPATIYDPFKDQVHVINNPEFFFYRQCLTGDKVDNIPGIKNPYKSHWTSPPNFSEATAAEVLEGKSKEEMREVVQNMYKLQYGDDWYVRYDTNLQLLFLKRALDSTYNEYF